MALLPIAAIAQESLEAPPTEIPPEISGTAPKPEVFQNTAASFSTPAFRSAPALRAQGASAPVVDFRTAGPKPDLIPATTRTSKIGPAIITCGLNSIGTSVLVTDNVDRTKDKKSGIFWLLEPSLFLKADISEDIKLAVNGRLVLQPLDSFRAAEYLDGNLFHAQLSHTMRIGGWTVVTSDDVGSFMGISQNQSRGSFNSLRATDEDLEGAYRLRATSSKSDNLESFFYSNIAGVKADRILPADVRLTVGGYHQDNWIVSGGDSVPKGVDSAFVHLQSERPNLRFKPFADYRVSKSASDNAQSFRAGIRGPVTERLDLLVGAGALNNENGTGLLYSLSLMHAAGPFTFETLSVAQRSDDFQQSISRVWSYSITQTLGSRVSADFFVSYSQNEILQDTGSASQSIRTGARLTKIISKGQTAQLSCTYVKNTPDEGVARKVWNLQLGYNFDVTDTLSARILYEHNRTEGRAEQAYQENSALFSLIQML